MYDSQPRSRHLGIIFRPTPLVFMGRQMRDLLRCAGPSLVLARRHIQSACKPVVVHILPPFTTRSSVPAANITCSDIEGKNKLKCGNPSLPFLGSAVVLILATSEPLPASLTPRHATMSPATEGARNSVLSSWEPNLDNAGVAMSAKKRTSILLKLTNACYEHLSLAEPTLYLTSSPAYRPDLCPPACLAKGWLR